MKHICLNKIEEVYRQDDLLTIRSYKGSQDEPGRFVDMIVSKNITSAEVVDENIVEIKTKSGVIYSLVGVDGEKTLSLLYRDKKTTLE